MKFNGIIRKFDDLGRIVIPKEIRNTLEMKEGTAVDITIQDNKVILEKCTPFECQKCGQAIDEEDKFCRCCGKEL